MKYRKSIALILSLFVMVVLFSFVTVSTYHFLADQRLQNIYENSIKVQYTLEAARAACLWEEIHAPFGYGWDSDLATAVDSTPRLSGAFIDSDNLYRLSGYDFRAKVFIEEEGLRLYVHAFCGTEKEPQSSQYLEYIHSQSPMHQYVLFSNTDIKFSGSARIDCKGGKIHSNADIIFSFKEDD
ncbi:hypothetical protein ACFL2W_00505, partial [Candidatus Omnitrophota bacterium]